MTREVGSCPAVPTAGVNPVSRWTELVPSHMYHVKDFYYEVVKVLVCVCLRLVIMNQKISE